MTLNEWRRENCDGSVSLTDFERDIWNSAYRAGQLAMRGRAEVLCVRIGGAKGSCDAVLCADKIRQLEPE